MAHVAGWLQGAHHLLERQVLMIVGSQRKALDPVEHVVQTRLSVGCHTQCQRIGKEADHWLQLGMLAVSDRRTYHHIGLPAQVAHEHRPSCQQNHERRAALSLAEGTQVGTQCWRKHMLDHPAGIALDGRARTVQWQIQHTWRTFQMLAPEVDLGLQGGAVEGLPLPGGVVGVLD